jgi:hypothetical protein
MSWFFQAIFRTIYELVIIFPMPWRLVIIALTLLPILFWLIFRGLPFVVDKLSYVASIFVKMLLKCEYIMTQYIRGKKHGDLLAAIVRAFESVSQHSKGFTNSTKKRWFPPRWLFIIVGITVSFIWYIRPSIGINSTSRFLRDGEIWWYSLEGWILNGKWKPSAASYAPEESIWAYFSTINNHQYLEAWNSTTANFKSNKRLMPNGYTDYLSFWKNDVERVNVTQTRLISKNGNSAIVNVEWHFFIKNNKTSKNTNFSLIWDVKTARWLIDNTK